MVIKFLYKHSPTLWRLLSAALSRRRLSFQGGDQTQ